MVKCVDIYKRFDKYKRWQPLTGFQTFISITISTWIETNELPLNIKHVLQQSSFFGKLILKPSEERVAYFQAQVRSPCAIEGDLLALQQTRNVQHWPKSARKSPLTWSSTFSTFNWNEPCNHKQWIGNKMEGGREREREMTGKWHENDVGVWPVENGPKCRLSGPTPLEWALQQMNKSRRN